MLSCIKGTAQYADPEGAEVPRGIHMRRDERRMEQQRRMTRTERMRRQEQMRRKKKRRLRRKIRRFCRRALTLVILGLVLLVLMGILKKTNILPGENLSDLEAPIQRTEAEVKERLEELAKKQKGFKEILEHYDEYPEVYRAALANNPEMLDYVKGYPDHDGTVNSELTKAEKKEDYPLFLQWDERWGYASYGSSSIGISGFGHTCLTMVSYGLTDKAKATPDKLHRYYIEGTGTSWELMTTGAASFGVTGEELSLDETVMKKELGNGHPIICAMRAGDFTAGGHFIVLYDYDKKGFMVNDPNSRARSEKRWTYDELKGQIKSMWFYH